jgi:hypothetical protein
MLTRDDRRGGILSGLLLSLFVILCLCVAAGVYIARNTHVISTAHGHGDDVSIETPAGRLDVRAHSRFEAAASGIPEYPGASRQNDSGGVVLQTTPNDGSEGKDLAVSTESLETPDPVERVAAWYRERLPGWKVGKDNEKAFELEQGEGKHRRIVALEDKHGYTKITLVSLGEPAAN